MVEDENLISDVRKLAKFVFGGCYVDEGNECILAISKTHAIFVSTGHVPGVFAPGTPDRPNSAEAIGAAGVVEAESLQDGFITW